MSALSAILIFLLFGVVVLFLTAPLRRSPPRGDSSSAENGRLEAAREAKYREIRDAELDYRTGKLSTVDYEAIDSQLRAEALEILDRLDASTPRGA